MPQCPVAVAQFVGSKVMFRDQFSDRGTVVCMRSSDTSPCPLATSLTIQLGEEEDDDHGEDEEY